MNSGPPARSSVCSPRPYTLILRHESRHTLRRQKERGLREETGVRPKPMLPIGTARTPVAHHQDLRPFRHKDFILCSATRATRSRTTFAITNGHPWGRHLAARPAIPR